MASLVKAVFGSSPPSTDSPLAKNHSFNDLSMGAQDHIEDSYNQPETADPSGPPADRPARRKSNSTWESTFNPGRNMHDNYKQVGGGYYDNVEPGNKGEDSVWAHYVRAERQRLFSEFDKNKDGFVTAGDLEGKFGASADIKQLIAAADTNGDGKIDLKEFTQLLKNS